MDKITAYKGFDENLKCRGFQYTIGETFAHNGSVVRCQSGGFHSCEYPLDVFSYYVPAQSRYAEVEASGDVDRDGDDSKIASGSITIKGELRIPQIVTRAVEWIMARLDRSKEQTIITGNYSAATNTGDNSAATNTGNNSAATNTGNYSAATNTGYKSAATNTGNYSAATNTGYKSAATNTGNYSAATNTGDNSAATNTGDNSAATNTGNNSAATNTGNYSAATNTGNYSAATNTGNNSAATNTGNYSAATNTGNYSAATNTGYKSAATNTGNNSAASAEGKHSVAIASGYQGKAKATEGSAIVLVYRNANYELIHIRSSKVGENGIKPGVFYSLDAQGDFVEVPSVAE